MSAIPVSPGATGAWRLPLLVGVLAGLPAAWAWPLEVGAWRAAGIVAGWLGLGLWVASLLLVVRGVRLSAWLGGLARMYRWHHGLAGLVYPLLLLHPLLLAADLLDEGAPVAWSLLSPLEQGWAVWSGWLALATLALGLALALQPGLAYRRWRAWHAGLVVPLLLAVLHLQALGLRQLLLGLPVLAAGLLLWRYLGSDCGWGAHPAEVVAVEHPQAGMIEATLRPMAGAAAFPVARPGQFVLLAFGDGAGFAGCGEFHPFTLSEVAADGGWRVAIKALGPCSAHLQTLQAGVSLRIQGPFGEFLGDAGTAPAWWFAGGVGITPFLARLRAPQALAATRLVYFSRSADAVAYRDELSVLAEGHSGFSWQLAVAQPGDDLAEFLPTADALGGQDCYLCGPPAWMAQVRAELRQRGVPEHRIFFERFEFR